ncbi:hypothetical protein [Aquipseudomonas alcaligenes]|uniref:hypothetical protein n=1 Tax=Aquipseudomonas alcaligenes TaxID=43263 RepID=UPI003667EF1B
MTRDDLLTLSQRLREYNHNPHHINPVSDAFHKLITESAEALSQFAAIQGGMGEVVEVVASLQAERLLGNAGEYAIVIEKHSWLRECQRTGGSFDLMTVAQHQRITAAMAAEVERLSRMLNNATNDGIKLADERDALATELAIARRVIDRIGQLCTTPHESKERFIRRVQSVIEWEAQALSAEASP